MAEFPEVSGSNLEGRPYRLPGDFEGKLNLAIVAFQRWHQDLVDTWVPLARRLRDAYPDFRYYELPTIWRMNPLFRWSIDAGMRAGIADRSAREATITLYLDKEPFRQALEIADEETIHLFLVDSAGRVAWRRAFHRRSGRSAGPRRAGAVCRRRPVRCDLVARHCA